MGKNFTNDASSFGGGDYNIFHKMLTNKQPQGVGGVFAWFFLATCVMWLTVLPRKDENCSLFAACHI